MIGEEARKARAFLDLSYPVNEGVTKNWDDMSHIWNYGFDKLGANTKESKILVTEPVFNSKKARIQMAELLFEKYQFNEAQMQIQALLSMFSEGKMTATVLDSGDSISYVVPCDEGYILKNLIKKINLAGRKITEYLTKLLFLRGYAFNSSADFETVREIKEKLCFISKDLSQDRTLAKETVCFEEEYELPDGQVVTLGKERFEASEILFDPYKGGYELEGLGDLVFESIRVSPTPPMHTTNCNLGS
jgi:actin-related protein 2